jgi:hypothetical protein
MTRRGIGASGNLRFLLHLAGVTRGPQTWNLSTSPRCATHLFAVHRVSMMLQHRSSMRGLAASRHQNTKTRCQAAARVQSCAGCARSRKTAVVVQAHGGPATGLKMTGSADVPYALTPFNLGLFNHALPVAPAGFVGEMRAVAMKLHTREQAPKEGGIESPKPKQAVRYLLMCLMSSSVLPSQNGGSREAAESPKLCLCQSPNSSCSCKVLLEVLTVLPAAVQRHSLIC